MKKIIIFYLFFFLFACMTNVRIKGKPPVIKAAFAPKVAKPGTNWRVYLEVEDSDGDLEKIYVFIYQPGIGMYPPWVAKIPQKYSLKLKGYFTLFIPNNLWCSKLKIEIFFKDKAGQKTETVYFPLKVVYKKEPLLNVNSDFKKYLGRIDINLISPLFDRYKLGTDWIWGR